jgi:hypothetical protein
MDCSKGCRLTYPTSDLLVTGIFTISSAEYLGLQAYDPTAGIPTSPVNLYQNSPQVLRNPLIEYASDINKVLIGATSTNPTSIYFFSS